MKRLMLILIVSVWLCRSATADLTTCLDATCRITGPSGIVGTGCVFDETADSYLVLTNAHVVGRNTTPTITCEFWKDGFSLGQVPGEVVQAWRSDNGMRDIAVASLAKASLSSAPAIIPLAPRGVELPSDTVLSAGCALGGWPTAWKGHVLDAGPSTVWFLPTPADGRSGSALFDEAGTMIVGLVAWRAADNSYGIAMHLGEIYAAFDGQPPIQTGASAEVAPIQIVQHASASRCIHGLPLSQLCAECQQGSCEGRFPFGLFGNRQPQEEKAKPFGDGEYNPWKGARGGASGGESGSSPPDLSSLATRGELATIESRLTESIQQVNQRIARLETQTQAALDQSQRAATQVEAQRKTSDLTQASILERLQKFASRDELIGKCEEAREAGAEAGRDAARNAALDIVAEKLGESGGMALWHTVLSALGISGPIGIGLAALGWFVSRRLGRRISQQSRGAGEAPQQAPFRGEST